MEWTCRREAFQSCQHFLLKKVFRQIGPYLKVQFLQMQDRMQIPSSSLNNPISYHMLYEIECKEKEKASSTKGEG